MCVTAVAVAACVALAYMLLARRARSRSPPGPRGLPLIGNAFQLNPKGPPTILAEWAARYGDIYRIKLFGSDVIVLSGYKTIHEALVSQSEAWAGRPHMFRLDVLNDQSRTVSFDDYSPDYLKLKKMTINALNIYGDGIARLQDMVLDQVGELTARIAATEGDPFDPRDYLQEMITGSITCIVFGRRLPPQDVRTIMGFERRSQRLLAHAGPGAELDLAPWLRFFPNSTYKELVEMRELRLAFFQRLIEENKRTVDAAGKATCLLDALLRHQTCGGGQQGEPRLENKDVAGVTRSFVFAGMSTSTSALYSFIALCVTHGELQRRLQVEVDTILGGRAPRVDDKASLPLVQAAVLELLRYTSHVPVAVPHKTTADVTMNGYLIAKGTRVFLNLWSLHHDPRYWDAPWEYRPERFLTSDGALVPADHDNRRRLMPFGGGRRICAGEVLAKNRLFLVIASLLQRFDFRPAEPDSPPKSDPRSYELGFVLYPQRYRVRAVRRYNQSRPVERTT